MYRSVLLPDRVADGELRVPVGARVDLTDAPSAQALLKDSASVGKWLLHAAD